MVRGRRPLPDAVKKLRGNPGGRPILGDTPRPPRLIRPDGAPTWLDATARREWRRLATELEETGVLTSWDYSLFATYCQLVSRVAMARRHLKKDADYVVLYSNGNEGASPWLKILERAEKELAKVTGLLGLSPGERSRLHITRTRKDGRTAAERAFGLTLPGRPLTDAEIDFGIEID